MEIREKLYLQTREEWRDWLKSNHHRQEGIWQNAYTSKKRVEMPEDLKDALSSNKIAESFFNVLTPSNKNRYINWVNFARRQETRNNRIIKYY